MCQAKAKNLDTGILTSSERSFHPYDISRENIYSNLIPESAFPFKLEGRKRVSRDCRSLLRDAHISAIYTDEAAVQTATIFPASENNLEEIRLVEFEKCIKQNHFFLPQQAQDRRPHE
jgi:hypothetical protein